MDVYRSDRHDAGTPFGDRLGGRGSVGTGTRRRLGRRAALALGLVLAALLPPRLAAAGSDVVRVRVPSKDVTRYFPPGTELRVLSPGEFESRVEAARHRPEVGAAAARPRLIRARHQARWDSGLLRGRSEFVVATEAATAVDLPLEPWTPAVLAGEGAARAVAARDSGATVLRVDAAPGERTLAVDWEQQPRALSQGRAFSLGLPVAATTVLELELPRGWTPSTQRGIGRGPLPAANPATSRWELHGESGWFDLHTGVPSDRAGAAAGAWVSGSTNIDLRRSANPAGALVNWSAECRLELDSRRTGQFEAELDPSLELIDVVGPAVQGYRAEHPRTGTRVVVTIAEGVKSTTVHVLAHARVPSEGRWAIPALRPRDATWTGGRTTVILDPLRVVSECRERAGRLVAPGRGGADDADWLAFEADAPRSVAELVFVRPRADAACTVRGRLDLARPRARLECRLDYTVSRGSVSQLEIDLSPAWLPDQVRIDRLADPLAWHPSTSASGATRLRVMVPASVLALGKWTLIVGATATSAAARGPLELPRVRPIGTAVLDEAWLAWADDGTLVQPVRASGLAWIDPDEVPDLATAAPSIGLRHALAWRWTTDSGSARVDRERVDRGPRSTIRARARIGPEGREMAIGGTLRVVAGSSALESIPIWVDAPGDPLASWRFTGDDDAELRPRPLGSPTRGRLGLREGIVPRALPLDLPARAETTVTFRGTMPWKSGGVVPLLAVPGEYLEQGLILVETPAGMKSSARPVDLGRLSPASLAPRPSLWAPEPAEPTGEPRDRLVHAFSYSKPGARLELVTEARVPAPMPGIVREALLATSLDARGRTLNRLRLLVNLHQARPLELVLPQGSSLVRVRRDGVDVAPIRSGLRLELPAPPAAATTRSSTFAIDYLMERGLAGDGSILRPDRPRLDLPCLSFTWEIVAPPGWRVLDHAGGLLADAPADAAGWPCDPLGLGSPEWALLPGGVAPGPPGWLGPLEAQLRGAVPEEWSFAEWFSRWDSGPRPLLVDRLALGSAGLGPRSSCFPGRLAADRRDPVGTLLHQHGLALVLFADALLITTESERPRFERRAPWLASIAESLAWGSDRADRFQTVERWRGEIGPRTGSVGDESTERSRPLPGRVARRFSAPGWPADDAIVHLIDARRRALWGWLLAAALALAWLGLAGRTSVRWLVVPAVVAAGCVVLDRALPARAAAMTAGGFVGSLAILIAELARRSRRAAAPAAAPAPTAARSGSALVRPAAAGPAALLLAAVALGSSRAAPSGDEQPVVALFPYEGTFDPARPSDRVILRLVDFRRLVRAAPEPDAPRSSVTAVAAAHRVARRDAREVLVETELELVARGPGPLTWRVPVSSAREISATLGGQPVPIAVAAGGEWGTVVLPTAGNYLLRIQRSASARTDATGAQMLDLPVNAAPTARLFVEPPADRVPQGTVAARGRMEPRPDGSLVGRLGPSDRIVVRWPGSTRADAPRENGPVDGLLLWDVTPAGDRLRARLTYHRDTEIASIRVAHDAGLMLRSARADGPSRVYWEDDPANRQWLLTFDPPLPPGDMVSVECWRSAPRAGAAGAAEQESPPPVVVRGLPAIRPVAAERFTGVLGVRRPGDWTGRLRPIHDTEPVDDEAFVKAWGRLPEEPLTLCGTTRFNVELAAELRTGPVPPRVVVRPIAEVRVESGRVVVAVDAEVQQISGHSPILEAELPEGLELTEVSGDGLIGWTVADGRRLFLTLRREDSGPARTIHLLGRIPLDDDPLAIGARPRHLRTPWILWPKAGVVRGSLTVTGRTAVTLRDGDGLAPVAAATLPRVIPAPATKGEPAAPAGFARSYNVIDLARLGELVWEQPPPEVTVVVESQLTLHADFARWVAVIRYDVIGGGLGRIDLKVPVAWAEQARLRVAGEDSPTPPRINTSTASAYYSIEPKRPLWGSHRLVFRSTRPLGSEREVVFPALAPLGKGGVDAYFGIVNATGRPLAAEDATGLQPVLYAFRFRDPEFARIAGTPAGAFRMAKTDWALRVQLAPGGTESSGPAPRDDAARVALADLALTVLPDRSVVGRGLYEVVPDSGRLLTVELPAGSTILWAAAEPNATTPLRAGPSTWSIVLDSERPERVSLLWTTPPAGAAPGRQPLALPRAGLGAARTLVSISTPPGATIEGTPPGFERAAIASLEKARADRLSQSISEFLAKLDRSSGRDHERLAALLIDHELALRAADRSAHREDALAPGSVGRRELLDSIETARSSVAQAVRSAGLADDLASAHGYLGLAPGAGHRPAGGIPEPIAPGRIRALGRPTALVGVNGGLDESSVSGGLVVADRQREDEPPRAAILSAAIILGALLAIALGSRWPAPAAGLGLVTMLATAALAGGPAMLAGGLGLVVVARRSVLRP